MRSPGWAGAGGLGMVDAEILAQDLEARGERSELTLSGAGRGRGRLGGLTRNCSRQLGRAALRRRKRPCVRRRLGGRACGRGARAVIPENSHLGSRVSVGPDTGMRSLGRALAGLCWLMFARTVTWMVTFSGAPV